MTKQDQILDEGLMQRKKDPQKSSFSSDLFNIFIGMIVLVAFIVGLILLIGSLLS
jgi:hypothetical protein